MLDPSGTDRQEEFDVDLKGGQAIKISLHDIIRVTNA